MKRVLFLILMAMFLTGCNSYGEKSKYLLTKYKRIATVVLGNGLAPDYFLVETEDGKYFWVMPSLLILSGKVEIYAEVPVGWSQK